MATEKQKFIQGALGAAKKVGSAIAGLGGQTWKVDNAANPLSAMNNDIRKIKSQQPRPSWVSKVRR